MSNSFWLKLLWCYKHLLFFFTILMVWCTWNISLRTGILPLLGIYYEHLLIKVLQGVALKFNLHNAYEKSWKERTQSECHQKLHMEHGGVEVNHRIILSQGLPRPWYHSRLLQHGWKRFPTWYWFQSQQNQQTESCRGRYCWSGQDTKDLPDL